MTIQSLDLHPLEIPFKLRFKHHSAERAATYSVVAVARTANGAIGLGEGCPRPYVTQEDVPSCQCFFAAWQRGLMDRIHTLADLRRWVRDHEEAIDTNPAAWCALELALLDALAREEGCSVERLLGLDELTGPFQYSAVLGDASLDAMTAQIEQYRRLGFADFKVKISGDPMVDRQKVDLLKEMVPQARLRLDANNRWSEAAAVLRYLDQLGHAPFALEEPLAPMDYAGLAQVAQSTQVALVLDESFLNRHHFPHLQATPDRFIINVRVSKMGGLLRSLAVAQQAAKLGVSLIVGAQVGETSILTRAALSVAQTSRARLLAQEGAFGTLLLARDIVARPLMFGAGGQLDPGALLDSQQKGWQMQYDLAAVHGQPEKPS